MGIGVAQIHHVQITAPRSLERECRAFYQEVLGLEEMAKSEESALRGGAWYRCGTVQVRLSLEDGEVASNRASQRHVCYVVMSLSEAERAIRAAGIEPTPDAHPEPGWRRFFVRDPAGNRVEVAEIG